MERDYMSVVCSSAASMPSNTTVTPNMRTSSGAAPLQPNQTGPLQSGPPHHHPISAVGCMASRILSRNANGTIAMTSQPTNESELQLYRVLQRANLLSYYDTFICQGGDDVQQLCEAGEEEFLEIMALVGMASKPLHVRRLQKALQEWVTNPAMFQSPIVPAFPSAGGPPLPPPSSHSVLNQLAVAMANRPSPITLSASQASPVAMRTSPSASMTATATQSCNSTHSTPSPNSGKEQIISSSTIHPQSQIAQYMNQVSSGMMCTEYSQPSSPITLTPVLVESQIQRLSEVAEMLVKSLPPMDPKPQLGNNKKRISKELEYVMNMPEDDPRRMDEIRKYAAIYGRFDCKRKPEKPLTLHEVSVNEAAAQICRHIPALLSRRDELFPLARQVVRDSGYQYSKGHSRSQSCTKTYDDSDQSSCKRSRTESSPNHESKINFNDEDRKRRQDRLESIVDQLKSLGSQHEDIKLQLQQANDLQNFQAVNQLQNELDLISTQQMQLINEQCEINKHLRRYEKMFMNRSYGRFEADKIDTDDTDSQFSLYSNESSPSVIQDSSQNSPNQEISQNSSDGFSKLLPTKKTGNTVAANHITKQLVHETLMEEGLRVVQELANQIKEDGVDLRVFNKVSDSPRTSTSSVCTVSSSSPALESRSGYKTDTPRPRGRPPKFLDREYQHPIYHNQMLTHNHHNHVAHQILSNFTSSHIQQNLSQLNSNGFGNCSVVNSIVDPEVHEMNDSKNGHFNPQNSQKSGNFNSPTDLSKYNNNSTLINGSTKDCNLSTSPNSLNALISLNSNGMSNEAIKQEPHSALELPNSLVKLT